MLCDNYCIVNKMKDRG